MGIDYFAVQANAQLLDSSSISLVIFHKHTVVCSVWEQSCGYVPAWFLSHHHPHEGLFDLQSPPFVLNSFHDKHCLNVVC